MHSEARSPVLLHSDDLEVVVDPRRGADILQIRHRALQLPLLFEVPWRKRADSVRAGALPASVSSFGRWLEGDAGGWQVLCPNAGAERDVEGGPVGFHGEASVVPWDVSARTDSELQLSVELFSVPVLIERRVSVEGTAVHVSDVLVNLGREAVRLDYSQHPSLGGALLDQPARLDTNAATFTVDWEAPGARLEPGARHRWPHHRRRRCAGPPAGSRHRGSARAVRVAGWIPAACVGATDLTCLRGERRTCVGRSTAAVCVAVAGVGRQRRFPVVRSGPRSRGGARHNGDLWAGPRGRARARGGRAPHVHRLS